MAVAALAALGAVGAQAQQAYEPQRGQIGKDVMWLPTPNLAVTRMLQMAEVKPSDRVVDLGSGDGKIPIAAAREFGATARGLEFNPKLVAYSKAAAQQAGVADRVRFEEADIFAADFREAQVVTMYLLPELNLKLRPTLLAMKPGTRVVSNTFTMGEWTPDEAAHVGSTHLMLWHVPANVSGDWSLTLDGQAVALNLSQHFQVLTGEARFTGVTAGLIEPQLRGDHLRFGLRNAQGQRLAFDGRVQGNRIEGQVTQGSQVTRFTATRQGGQTDVSQAPPVAPPLVMTE
ncbi:hypothetical protein CCO03_08010 [Comamonas serinivorans]|uniref:Methyltransferase domain-containing protein n=1 Tax=Comamonas serinivorans TaxID=1082851 RepID=A0A1Y0EMU7_9BURK|nr:hypothetical protein CCO03_08010 [Comamonas serinivorans]